MHIRTWSCCLVASLLTACPKGDGNESGTTVMMADSDSGSTTVVQPTTSGPEPTTTMADSTSTGTNPPPACADEDLGSMLGPSLTSGTIDGAGDEFELSCGPGNFDTDSVGVTTVDPGTTSGFGTTGTTGGGVGSLGVTSIADSGGFDPDSEDYAISWTAPAAGTYSISLEGSDYDTVLAVFDGCEGEELACNDDCYDLQSGLSVDLQAGQQIVIVIEGYGGQVGTFTLGITEGEARCLF